MTTAPDTGAAAREARGRVARRIGSRAAVEVIGLAVHELQGDEDEALEVRPLEVHELPSGLHEPSVLRLVPAPAPGPEEDLVDEAVVEADEAADASDAEADTDEAPGANWPFRTSALRERLAVVPASVGPLRPIEDRVQTETTAPTWRPAERPDRADVAPGIVARRRARVERPALPWLRRRWWVVALLLVAGVAGGYTMTKGHRGTFSSEVLLEVRSGSTPANPGGAQEASALAVTYAALVPSDTAVTSAVANRLGVSQPTVSAGLSATAESGTGLFLVTYTAPTASQAIAGANEAGAVLASAAPPGLAIIERSVAVVKEASQAKQSKDMRLYGEVGGAGGGLLLGLIFLLVLERVDARVDDPEDAAEACGCPATRWPGGMSARELTVALARQAPDEALTVVPTSRAALQPAERLGELLAEAWPDGTGEPQVSIVAPFEESPAALSEGSGPTVLAVTPGEPVRALSEACARLGLLGRAPLFVVLVARS